MEEEINRFIQVNFVDDVSFQDFVTGQHSYMNQKLGDYYGVSIDQSNADSDGFCLCRFIGRSSLWWSVNPRCLTHGSCFACEFVSCSSWCVDSRSLYVSGTSSTACKLDTSPPAMDPSLSTRERYEQHSSDPACSSCHDLIDSIGFGFEHFDGNWSIPRY